MTVLHQTWKTHDVPCDMDYRDSWRKHNPDLAMNLFNNEECESFVAWVDSLQDDGCTWLETYKALPHDIMRADMFRYCVLWHLGGAYADLDVECLGPMDALSTPGVHLIEEKLHPGFTVGPYLMASSEPCHPFWLHCLSLLCDRAKSIHKWDTKTPEAQHSTILNTTGPYMLTDAWRSYPASNDFYLHTEASLGVKHHAVGSWWRK